MATTVPSGKQASDPMVQTYLPAHLDLVGQDVTMSFWRKFSLYRCAVGNVFASWSDLTTAYFVLERAGLPSVPGHRKASTGALSREARFTRIAGEISHISYDRPHQDARTSNLFRVEGWLQGSGTVLCCECEAQVYEWADVSS